MLHLRERERHFYVCKTKVSFIKHEQNESFIKPLFSKLLHSFHCSDLHNGFTNDLHRNVFMNDTQSYKISRVAFCDATPLIAGTSGP